MLKSIYLLFQEFFQICLIPSHLSGKKTTLSSGFQMSDSGIDEPIEAEHMEESDPVDDAEDMAEVDNHVEVVNWVEFAPQAHPSCWQDEPFQVVEEEEDGEDLAETLEKDYERIEKLDNYEGGEHMDDTKYQGMVPLNTAYYSM